MKLMERTWMLFAVVIAGAVLSPGRTAVALTTGWSEVGEAGELPGSAQMPIGAGALPLIQGTLTTLSGGRDDIDMYMIGITDPAAFSVDTSGTLLSGDNDAQLFVFDQSGHLVAFDDDGSGSYLPHIFPGALSAQPVGVYFLAIDLYNTDPTTDPVTSWSRSPNPMQTGPYQLALTGAEYVPEPATLSLLTLGGLALVRRRKRWGQGAAHPLVLSGSGQEAVEEMSAERSSSMPSRPKRLTNVCLMGVATVALLCSYVQAGTESPILHWTFDDPTNITRDASGNGHDLIIPSTWSSVAGVAGNAIHFDEYSAGSTNLGPSPEGPYTPTSGMNYPTSQGFAVAYWSKLDTESSVIDYWQHRAAGETFSLNHQMNTGLAQFTVRHDFTDPPVLTGTAYSSYIDGWMHLVGVYDPSNGPKARLYVNGELAAERNMPAPMRTSIPPNVFTSGSWHGTNESTVDDVRIYNRALSSSDVLSLYAGPAPPVADADGPYSVWAGDPLILNASGSTDSDGQIVSYMWDLDDDGNFETDAGDQPFFVVDYEGVQDLGLAVGGMYDIHLQVTDSTGLFDTDSSSLRVTPEPATLTLLTLGGLALVRRRKHRACK